MTYVITDRAALVAIYEAYRANDWNLAYGRVYQALSDVIYEDLTDPLTGVVIGSTSRLVRKEDVDPAVYLWVEGARKVNSNEGAFAAYIREYTAEQYELRKGSEAPDMYGPGGRLQTASNDIAKNFIRTLFNVPLDKEITEVPVQAVVPSLRIIGGIDAAGAAANVFKDAASTAGGNYSPWAGTVLFANLGDNSFFKEWVLTQESNNFKKEPGTYDLISIAQATISQKTAGRVLHGIISGEFPRSTELVELGRAAKIDASNAAQKFFEDSYGPGVSAIKIGSFIFDDALGLQSVGGFKVGTVGDDKGAQAITFTGSTRVVNGGGGDDELISKPEFKSTTVVDGGEGADTVDYTAVAGPITMRLDGKGAYGWRAVLDIENPIVARQIVVNVETIKLGASNDKLILTDDAFKLKMKDVLSIDFGASAAASGGSPSDGNTLDASAVTGNTTIKIGDDGLSVFGQNGNPPSLLLKGVNHVVGGSGINAVDFTEFGKSVIYNDGKVVGSEMQFENFSKLIGSELADQLTTDEDFYFIDGAGGDDTLMEANKGNHILIGGEGNDTFKIDLGEMPDFYASASTVESRTLLLWGGAGSDTFDLTGSGTISQVYIPGLTSSALAAADVAAFGLSGVVILNPDPNDRIVWNGTVVAGASYSLISTETSRSGYAVKMEPLPGDGYVPAGRPDYATTQWVDATWTRKYYGYQDLSGSWYLAESPTPLGGTAVGADFSQGAVLSISSPQNNYGVLKIAGFVNGDMGIALSGSGPLETRDIHTVTYDVSHWTAGYLSGAYNHMFYGTEPGGLTYSDEETRTSVVTAGMDPNFFSSSQHKVMSLTPRVPSPPVPTTPQPPGPDDAAPGSPGASGAGGNVLTNVSPIVMGDTLSIVSVQPTGASSPASVSPGTFATVAGAYGRLTIASDGTYNYLADSEAALALTEGQVGLDSFTYAVMESNGADNTATLTFQVTGRNASTVDLSGNAVAGQTLSADVSNVHDVNGVGIIHYEWQISTDGQTWSSLGVTEPTYTLSSADVGFKVRLKISYTDGGGKAESFVSAPTDLVAEARPNNAPESALGVENASANEDSAITGTLLAGSDVDGDALTFRLVSGSATNGAVVVDRATGAYTFTPDRDFNGTASFRYRVSDGMADSPEKTVFVTVASVNDAPLITSPAAMSTEENVPVSGRLTATDVDGDYVSFYLKPTATPTLGTVVVNADGTFNYVPSAHLTGADSFIVVASDGHGGTSEATVSVAIKPVNHAPVAADDTGFKTSRDTAVTITAASLLGNDTDVDGDTLTISSVGNAVNGKVLLDAAGDVVFAPSAGYGGTASFTYTVSDGKGGNATAVAQVTVDPNRMINGTSGDDVLWGTPGTNTFVGGLGNDTIHGGQASDTYVYARGHGNDIVQDDSGSISEVDLLSLIDLTAADVTLSRSGSDLIVTTNGNGQTIKFSSQFSSAAENRGIEQIRFADGALWDRSQIKANAWFRGGDGNDTLFGTADNDTRHERPASTEATTRSRRSIEYARAMQAGLLSGQPSESDQTQSRKTKSIQPNLILV